MQHLITGSARRRVTGVLIGNAILWAAVALITIASLLSAKEPSV